MLDQLPPLLATRHHRQRDRFAVDVLQRYPAIAAQLGVDMPIEGILVVIATPALLFDDCPVFDPDLVGKTFHRRYQQTFHRCREVRMVRNRSKHVLLLRGALYAPRQCPACNGPIALRIEHLKMAFGPVRFIRDDLCDPLTHRRDKIGGDQSFNHTVTFFPIGLDMLFCYFHDPPQLKMIDAS